MILLDTNVISDAMKPAPYPVVRIRLEDQSAETPFLCTITITIAELSFGIGALPKGQRKYRLSATLDGVLALFADRILPIDPLAARRYGHLAVKARMGGKGFPTLDGYSTAIAGTPEFAGVAQHTRAFIAAGLTVIDSWA